MKVPEELYGIRGEWVESVMFGRGCPELYINLKRRYDLCQLWISSRFPARNKLVHHFLQDFERVLESVLRMKVWPKFLDEVMVGLHFFEQDMGLSIESRETARRIRERMMEVLLGGTRH